MTQLELVPLGGKLIADVGAPAQHPLAGGGLLPGGAVAGLVGEDDGADLVGLRGQVLLAQLFQDGLDLRGRDAGLAAGLQGLGGLGPGT